MTAKKSEDRIDNGGQIKAKRKPKHQKLPYMQNRELSWLNFNKRVLDQGEDHNVPPIERLTFVSIFSSNLQEFFMVRVGSLTDLNLVKKELRDNKTLMTPAEQLDAIYTRCHELYPEQERIFDQILKQLAEYGIVQHTIASLDDEQRTYLRTYLHNHVVPYLSPQVINARHPFPHLENGALYVLLRLDEEERRNVKDKGTDANSKSKKKNVGADDATFGLIPLPRQAKRVIQLPGDGTQFILLEEALKLIVDDVFSMYVCKRASVICVTRNADIDANEGVDEIDYDYREHMKRILKKRARLAPVRLETDTPLSKVTEAFLLEHLNLNPNQVFVTRVPLDMGYAWGLADMVAEDVAKGITNVPFAPSWPACLDRNRSIIDQVCEQDKLLSYPYQSMDPFIQMLREAAVDPSVISIKITLYRLASRSQLAEALLTAAENGKEVTALFELRARFDEANNIDWSQRFEEAGANVIYGFHDFKVHSKICVITRSTENGLQHITQLGTGNYNEKTSKLYTDFSYITTNEDIGRDAAEFFRNMNLENTSNNYSTLAVAPLQIKQMILEKIDEQIALAKEGKPNGLLFKTNSVTDKEIIDKIAEASQAGVSTTLFVRGISCIVPGVKDYTENVEVVSIVGRLLEHSRIYGFGEFDDMEIYLSSADLMTRNMDKRIEIAWPVRKPELREQVIDYLSVCLSDTAKLRMLGSDGEFTPLEYFAEIDPETGKPASFDSQAYLIKRAAQDLEAANTLREQEEAERSATALRMDSADIEITDVAPAKSEPAVEAPQGKAASAAAALRAALAAKREAAESHDNSEAGSDDDSEDDLSTPNTVENSKEGTTEELTPASTSDTEPAEGPTEEAKAPTENIATSASVVSPDAPPDVIDPLVRDELPGSDISPARELKQEQEEYARERGDAVEELADVLSEMVVESDDDSQEEPLPDDETASIHASLDALGLTPVSADEHIEATEESGSLDHIFTPREEAEEPDKADASCADNTHITDSESPMAYVVSVLNEESDASDDCAAPLPESETADDQPAPELQDAPQDIEDTATEDAADNTTPDETEETSETEPSMQPTSEESFKESESDATAESADTELTTETTAPSASDVAESEDQIDETHEDAPESVPEAVVAEVIEDEQDTDNAPVDAVITNEIVPTVTVPAKPGFFKRLKFLFTGHF